MPSTRTLQEVILVEHFASPLTMTVIDMADWANTFNQYRNPQQLNAAAPVSLLPQAPSWFPVDLPRLLLRSEFGDRSIQLQSDRFAVGWSRTVPVGEPCDYPSYEALKATWGIEASKFHDWCAQRLDVRPSARLFELGYNNATPIVVSGTRRRISDIFRWVQPSRPVNAFEVSWLELMSKDRADAARVTGFVTVGSAPPVSEALIFNFTGFGPADGSVEPDPATRMFDSLHQRITEMYEAAIIPEQESS
ncbi:MAG: hypothetical protein JOZ60_02435 [Verrucomicrobia bacterium]|nr:hypothetical protein [Verrucomicrobiota bacterium]